MKRRLYYKIAVLGDKSVGRTRLIERFCSENNSRITLIDIRFYSKNIQFDGHNCLVVIWEPKQGVKFKTLRQNYYKVTDGIFLVFDVTRPGTLDAIPKWIREVVMHDIDKPHIAPMVLVGNKSDLRASTPSSLPFEAGRSYSEALSRWAGFEIPYIETSAEAGENIDEAFLTLIRSIYQHRIQALD